MGEEGRVFKERWDCSFEFTGKDWEEKRCEFVLDAVTGGVM